MTSQAKAARKEARNLARRRASALRRATVRTLPAETLTRCVKFGADWALRELNRRAA